MSRQLSSTYLWSGAAVFAITVAGGNTSGSELNLLLGDLKASALQKYVLPAVLASTGLVLLAMSSPRTSLCAFSQWLATKLLGAWSGIAAATTGWIIGTSALALWHTPSQWLAPVAITSVGVLVFLSPWHLLSEAIDTLADYESRIFVPPWKRSVARWAGIISFTCGLYVLFSNIAGT